MPELAAATKYACSQLKNRRNSLPLTISAIIHFQYFTSTMRSYAFRIVDVNSNYLHQLISKCLCYRFAFTIYL